MRFNCDRVNHANINTTSAVAMTVITALQDYPPEEQVIGLAAVFRMFTEVHPIDLHDLFTVVDNMLTRAEPKDLRPIAAVRDYMKGELV